ncbi:hypothetical protein BRC89_11555 [Halobacteriales archaeon QS_4_70_19]|nr:MAG: hypothetical protein BRC89_11555 [Halobacteriales archaeon QS_4_70_19]
MEVDLRAAIVGVDRVRSLEGATVATGLYALVLGGSFLGELPAMPGLGAVLEPGGVLAGVTLAGWWAYRNSGLVVSAALVLGPVLGRLTYYAWLFAYEERGAPVALILSFGGSGSWEFWMPFAVLLGALAFGGGVAVRWGRGVVTRRAGS